MLGGGLSKLKISPIHLELRPNAAPYHAKAFGIPKAPEATTAKRLLASNNLVYGSSRNPIIGQTEPSSNLRKQEMFEF